MQHCSHQIRYSVGMTAATFVFILASLRHVRSSLKPIHARLTIIRLVTAFRLSTGQEQFPGRNGLYLSFAAIQSKKNWRFALAAMHAEIPAGVDGF